MSYLLVYYHKLLLNRGIRKANVLHIVELREVFNAVRV